MTFSKCGENRYKICRESGKEKKVARASTSVGGSARLEIYFPTKCRHRGLAAPPAAGYDIPRRVMHIRIFPYINFIEVKVDACLLECADDHNDAWKC